MGSDPLPWLKSREEGQAIYWRWKCPKCGAAGLENSDRDGAIHGYVSHVQKSHRGDPPPDRNV